MNITRNTHLNEDQILTAIVDAHDLPPSVREHLATCLQCRRAVEEFDGDLSTFKKLARDFSPTLKNRIVLPAEKSSASIMGTWKWQLSFGAAFSVLLVFGILWWSAMTGSFFNGNTVNVSEEMFEDEQLMTEISDLSENALPSLYMNITGEPDPETVDDFMEFIDPLNEDTSMS